MHAHDNYRPAPPDNAATAGGRPEAYAVLWRWHFYAGLFCLPFILWLPVTGAIYLFKPQIEQWLDRPYDDVGVSGPAAAPSTQVAAALAAVPGTVLHSYVLPSSPRAAVQILVGRERELHRVYVHPQSVAVLKVEREDMRPMRLLFHLHGELLLGSAGSMLVETAASWAVIMIVTGLYLWWPRGTGTAGTVYPRLARGGRIFWRDLHAVTGLWVSLFVLFLLVSGLPWAKFWGGTLKELRQLGAGAIVRLDWTTGRASELAERAERNTPAAHGSHTASFATAVVDYAVLDRLVPTVEHMGVAAPALISPPSRRHPDWNARSDHPNRMLHQTLMLDSDSGAVKSRREFADSPLIDRVIGIAVSAHEGQLFGWPNQLLGLLTAIGLVGMAISATVMWWARRSPGTLGAPATDGNTRVPLGLTVIGGVLALLLPLFGASALAIVAVERMVLQRFAGVSRFLGLVPRGASA